MQRYRHAKLQSKLRLKDFVKKIVVDNDEYF